MLTADGDLGERLGVFYAAYLTGFVLGPPLAGALTVIADVRLPFVVFAGLTAASSLALRDLVVDEPGSRQALVAPADRRVMRRLLRGRRLIAALLVVVSFRYSIGVFEPLWATYLDDLGASTMTITISLTLFALPMLIIARRAGRLSDRYGPRLTSILSAAATVPLMASYGYVGSLPLILALSVPHGLGEAIQSPASQAAVAQAAPAARRRCCTGSGRGSRISCGGDRCVHGGTDLRPARRRTGLAHRRRHHGSPPHGQRNPRPTTTPSQSSRSGRSRPDAPLSLL